MGKHDAASTNSPIGSPDNDSSAASSKEYGSAVSSPTNLNPRTGSTNSTPEADSEDNIVTGTGTGTAVDLVSAYSSGHEAIVSPTATGGSSKTIHPRSLLVRRSGIGSSSGTVGSGTVVGVSGVNSSSRGLETGAPRRRLSAIVSADEVTAELELSLGGSPAPSSSCSILTPSTSRSRRGSGAALAAMAALAIQEHQTSGSRHKSTATGTGTTAAAIVSPSTGGGTTVPTTGLTARTGKGTAAKETEDTGTQPEMKAATGTGTDSIAATTGTDAAATGSTTTTGTDAAATGSTTTTGTDAAATG
eukprot:Lankesteria_metandrocarpae@DN6497_c0_g1_i1.p1